MAKSLPVRSARALAVGLLAAAAVLSACAGPASTPASTTGPVPTSAEASAPSSSAAGPFVVGRGRTALSQVLAQLYATALARAGQDVAFTVAADAPDLVSALMAQRVSLVPALVGPIAASLARPADATTPAEPAASDDLLAEARTVAAAAGVDLLEPSAGEARPVLVVTTQFADRTGVTTVDDLAAWSQTSLLRLAGPPGCDVIDWCLPAFESVAHARVSEYVPLTYQGTTTVDALRRGEADAGILLSVDPAAAQSGVVVLDSGPARPGAWSVVPAVAHTAARPDVVDVLDRVSAALSSEVLDQAVRAANAGTPLAEIADRVLSGIAPVDAADAPIPVVDVAADRPAPQPDRTAATDAPLAIASTPTVASEIVARLYGQTLADLGVAVRYAPSVNPRDVPTRLADGSVDLVPVLLGNDADWLNVATLGPLVQPFSSGDVTATRDRANDLAEDMGYQLLEPAAAQQTSSFTVRREFADRTGVTTLSELADYSRTHTVAVVGDGAVGLLGVMAAQQLGSERIIVFSRHPDRQALAREFGATDIVEERGDDGVERVKELTNGLGAHSVIEAFGTQEAMMQALHATRPGGHLGFVGVSHDVAIPGMDLFMSGVHIHGGPAPVRRFLPDLVDRIWHRRIDPGKVLDLTLPLDQAADGYRAMDQRTATKVLLTP